MPKNKKYSAIIIGAGCLGASVFRSLKLRGLKNILLIDKGRLGGGISAQSGGMTRVFHKNLCDQIAAKYAQEVFYQIHKKTKMNISRTGALSLILKKDLESINKLGFNILPPSEVRRRFPEFKISDEEVGIFEEKGGSISVESYIREVVDFYKDSYDDVLINTAVESIDSSATGSHKVITNFGEFTAPNIIVSSGLGVRDILPDVYEGSSLQKKNITTFDLEVDAGSKLVNLFDYTNIFYSSKAFGGRANSFKAGGKSNAKNPYQQVLKNAKSRFAFDYSVNKTASLGHDIYLKNRQGLSGEICGRRGVHILSGWGGGAFKFSPYLGDKAAENILTSYFERGRNYEVSI